MAARTSSRESENSSEYPTERTSAVRLWRDTEINTRGKDGDAQSSLVQSIQIQDADLAEEIAGLHRRQHATRLTQHLEDAVGDDEHLPGDLALPTNRVAGREDVSFHLEHEVVEKFGLTFLENRDLSGRDAVGNCQVCPQEHNRLRLTFFRTLRLT